MKLIDEGSSEVQDLLEVARTKRSTTNTSKSLTILTCLVSDDREDILLISDHSGTELKKDAL